MADRGTLIVICGLPGAGKTTLARVLEDERVAVRLNPDEWIAALGLDIYDEAARGRIEALQWTLAQRLLTLGNVVIIEWGTWGRSERDALRLGAREIGAAVELRYLDAPLDVLHARLLKRDAEDPPIERADLVRWAALIQVPDAKEMALFDAPVL